MLYMNNSSSKRSRAVFKLDAHWHSILLRSWHLWLHLVPTLSPISATLAIFTCHIDFAAYAFTLLGSLLIIGSLILGVDQSLLQPFLCKLFLLLVRFRCFDVIYCTRLTATGLAVSAIGAAILDFGKAHWLIVLHQWLVWLSGFLFYLAALRSPVTACFWVSLLICELILSFLTPETVQKVHLLLWNPRWLFLHKRKVKY